jgi:Galactose oxidase, central domain
MSRRSPSPRVWGAVAVLFACSILFAPGLGAGSSPGTNLRANASTATAPAKASLHWHSQYEATAPAGRNWVAMAYDSSANETVLYGGFDPYSGTTFYTDTWTYVAGNWTPLSPPSHPSASTGLVLADDPALKGVLAFGGQGAYGSAYYSETWLFKGGTWNLLSPTVSPSARSQYAMAYDNSTSEMILFGGNDGGSQFLSDTWAFNGTTWTQVHSRLTPPGRAYAGMVYDGSTHSVLLLGGENASTGTIPGTWSYSGGQWTKHSGSERTPLIVFPALATMDNGTPLLAGGLAAFGTLAYNTTYEFFAGAWHLVRASHPPPARSNGGFVNDRKDGYFLQFGGEGTGGGAYLGDTWRLT